MFYILPFDSWLWLLATLLGGWDFDDASIFATLTSFKILWSFSFVQAKFGKVVHVDRHSWIPNLLSFVTDKSLCHSMIYTYRLWSLRRSRIIHTQTIDNVSILYCYNALGFLKNARVRDFLFFFGSVHPDTTYTFWLTPPTSPTVSAEWYHQPTAKYLTSSSDVKKSIT